MTLLTFIIIVLSFISLITAAHFVVKGASKIASHFGMSSLTIGLTIVAFGTSAPEIAINLTSLSSDHFDLAFGNILGSNIFNILFILGITAVITPLKISMKLIRIDVPIMILASMLVWLFAQDYTISRTNGVMLIGLLAMYILFSLYLTKKESRRITQSLENAVSPQMTDIHLGRAIIYFLIGSIAIAISSHFLVLHSLSLARELGLSELIIGLTILSYGSGAPEIAVSVMAAKGKEYDIAVGNIIGSCIFNILLVLGLSSIIYPYSHLSIGSVNFDIPIMIGAAIVCLPLFLTQHKMERWEGALLLFYFVAYLTYIILHSQGHDSAKPYGLMMVSFVLPMTATGLIITLVDHFKTITSLISPTQKRKAPL